MIREDREVLDSVPPDLKQELSGEIELHTRVLLGVRKYPVIRMSEAALAGFVLAFPMLPLADILAIALGLGERGSDDWPVFDYYSAFVAIAVMTVLLGVVLRFPVDAGRRHGYWDAHLSDSDRYERLDLNIARYSIFWKSACCAYVPFVSGVHLFATMGGYIPAIFGIPAANSILVGVVMLVVIVCVAVVGRRQFEQARSREFRKEEAVKTSHAAAGGLDARSPRKRLFQRSLASVFSSRWGNPSSGSAS